MSKSPITTAVAAVVLAGCSPASAAGVDANNDIHCYLMATGFRMAADFSSAPQYQKSAAKWVEEWYRPKFDDAVRARGREQVSVEGDPVVKAFEADMLSLKDDHLSCAERATKEAGVD